MANSILCTPRGLSTPEGEQRVDCQIGVSQLNKIYSKLSPHAKATAVLNGLMPGESDAD